MEEELIWIYVDIIILANRFISIFGSYFEVFIFNRKSDNHLIIYLKESLNMRAELFYTTTKLKYPGEIWDQKYMYAVFHLALG